LLFCRQRSTRRPIRIPLLLVGLVVLGGLVSAAGAAGSAPRNGLIAFGSNRTAVRNKEIYVMNADGSDERRLSDQPGHDSGPVWSPDGRRIAFFSRRNGNTDIYVMNPDGTGVRRLTQSPNYDFTPDWSPDGKHIVYMSFPPAPEGKRPPQRLYVMNADGGRRRPLTPDIRAAGNPDWSPDGRRIAFESDYGIYLVNADGSGLRRLTRSTRGPGWDSEPAWSPDGRWIAFTSSGDTTPLEIYLMKADGTWRRRPPRAAAATGLRPGRPTASRSSSSAAGTRSATSAS
jgi:Tol biopolymer transport system component